MTDRSITRPATPAPEEDALPDNACGVMGLCELLKGHEGKHTTSVDRALEGAVLRGLRARIRQVVDQFGGGAISDEDADAAAGVLYGTPPETPASEDELRGIMSTVSVLKEVRNERRRQDAKFPGQTAPSGTQPETYWSARYNARRWCDEAFATGQGTWLDILREEFYEAAAEADPVKLRAELIQVAAVAVRWVENIDKGLA